MSMASHRRARARASSRRARVSVHAMPSLLLGALVIVASCALLPNPAIATNYTPNQNSALQLGSTSFTSTNRGPNMSYGLDRPFGVQLDAAGRVLVGDFGNNRLALYNSLPASDGAPVDLAVRNLSKADYRGNCAATQGRHVTGAWSGGGKLAVVESVETSAVNSNSRVLLYDTVPTIDGAAPSWVLGQTSFTTCGGGAPTATSLARPTAVWTNGTKIIVADRDNNRVLVWNAWPTANGAPAAIVLGQANMTSNVDDDGAESASTLDRPTGVWSDGTRIMVADTFNNRVLVWSSWPTMNGPGRELRDRPARPGNHHYRVHRREDVGPEGRRLQRHEGRDLRFLRAGAAV